MSAHARSASIGVRPASVSRRERLALTIAIGVSVPSLLLAGGMVSLPSLVEHGIEWLLPGHSQSSARGLQALSLRYSPVSVGQAAPDAVNVRAAVKVPPILSRAGGRARHGVAGAIQGPRRPRTSHQGSGALGTKAPGATGAGNPAPSGSDDGTSSPPSDGAGNRTPAPPTVTVGPQGSRASASVTAHGTHVTASVSVAAANSAVTADAAPASGSAGAAAAVATPAGEVAASAEVAAPAASATVATPVASATVATPSETAPAVSATVASPAASATVGTAAVAVPPVSLPPAITP